MPEDIIIPDEGSGGATIEFLTPTGTIEDVDLLDQLNCLSSVLARGAVKMMLGCTDVNTTALVSYLSYYAVKTDIDDIYNMSDEQFDYLRLNTCKTYSCGCC